MNYDLVIIGGGFTGVAAAISASRENLKVLLVEKGNSLGGAAGMALVNPFMPTHTTIDGKLSNLSQGLYLEIREELYAFAEKYHGNRKYKEIRTFSEEYLKLILNRLCIKNGVELLFNTRLVDAVKEDIKLTAVKLANKSGISTVSAKYFVDATGDMDLGVMSGCDYSLGREADSLCQPMTLCFRLANVDPEKYIKNKPIINEKYQEFQKAGKIKNPRENVLIFRTLADNILHFNTTRVVKRNPVDAKDVTIAEIEAREQVFEIYDFLRENIEGFEDCILISTASEIGVRESRMLRGEYVLTQEDIVACKKFDDSIAVGNYDIDIHNPEGSGTSHYYFPQGEYYSIPYRSLLPKELDNLYIAGRCASATHEAQASIRIMPIVCCMGEAVGLAASIACKNNVSTKNVDITHLHQLLDKYKARYK